MTINDVDILLVEDNLSDVTLALHAFKKHQLASRVHVIRDGAAALEFLFATGAYAQRDIANVPKVILLDLKLPLVNGLEVLRQIKRDPRTQPIPVVMLTASREERDIVASYQLGVNSYIIKPVDFDQFNEAMRTLGLFWLLHNQPPILLGKA